MHSLSCYSKISRYNPPYGAPPGPPGASGSVPNLKKYFPQVVYPNFSDMELPRVPLRGQVTQEHNIHLRLSTPLQVATLFPQLPVIPVTTQLTCRMYTVTLSSSFLHLKSFSILTGYHLLRDNTDSTLPLSLADHLHHRVIIHHLDRPRPMGTVRRTSGLLSPSLIILALLYMDLMPRESLRKLGKRWKYVYLHDVWFTH